MKKVSNRLYIARKIFDYSLLVIFMGFLMLLWQLYRGPIAVPFLKPYIIAALNPDSEEAEVTVESVNIELVQSVKPIKIIANNVVYKRRDDTIRFTAPRTSVSFSIKALLHGVIAPSSVELEDPSVYIFTTYGLKEQDEASQITEKKLDFYVTQFEDFIERFNSQDNTYPESYINNISVIGGEAEFHEVDLGRKWVLSDFNFKFNRGFSNITAEIGALLNLDETIVSVGVEAGYHTLNNKLTLQAYFGDLVPSEIINNYVDEKTRAEFYQINLPVSGKASTSIDFNQFLKNRDDLLTAAEKAINEISFQFEGGQGSIIFAPDEQSKYDISSFILDGKISGGLNNLEIKNADFNLGDQKVKLGFIATGLENLLLKSSWKDLKLKLIADINAFKLNDLYIYWPRYIATEGWEWCKDSLFGGDAKNGHFEFDFAYNPKTQKFGFHDLKGKAYIEDSNVRYMDTMPMVTNVYGELRVYSDSLEVGLDKAKSNGILLDSGLVRIYDLDKEDNYIMIKLIANSSITDALKLIDHPPLEFAKELGLDPEILSGTADTDLQLDFELRTDLSCDDVKVTVKSKLYNMEVRNLPDNHTLKSEIMELAVDNSGLELDGDALFDEIPVNISWNERFKKDKDNTSRYRLKFKADEDVLKKFGIDNEIFKQPYMSGSAQITAVAKPEKSGYHIDIDADLKNLMLNFGFLGLNKSVGQTGKLKGALTLKNAKISSVTDTLLKTSAFEAEGLALFDEHGRLKHADITKLNAEKIRANAKIDCIYDKKTKYIINVSGNSYDLSHFFEKSDETSKDSKTSAFDQLENVPDMDINIAVNTLWSGSDTSLSNFAGTANMLHGIGINELHLIGNFDRDKNMTLKVDYIPKPNKEYYLTIDSNAAGNTLRFLHIYDDIHGGNLKIEARRDADKMFIGHAKIRDYSLHDTPVLVKLLTVASFSGMVDLLTGEGMTFSHFDAPFKYKNGILYVNKARTYGNVLGITFNGAYNMNDEALNIEGMIAPAYGLNTLIGKIPLLGNLLVGKDGTVFAANYSISGTASSPEISLNPLSALSPNSLKEAVASVFGQEEGDEF